jgi:hypothetical protein
MRNLQDTLGIFNRHRKYLEYIVILCLLFYPGLALNRQITDHKGITLNSLANVIPALNTRVDITVSSAPVQEFLVGIANQA